jgi:hypothetical protein
MDITKCEGYSCSFKETCLRYKGEANKHAQQWFVENPANPDKTCEYYWQIKPNTPLTEKDEWKQFNEMLPEILKDMKDIKGEVNYKYKDLIEEFVDNRVKTFSGEDCFIDNVITAEDAIGMMTQLAKEVENESLRAGYYAKLIEIGISLYTKQQVEALLQKQRELSILSAKVTMSKGYPEYAIVDEDSIRNAKLEI